MKALSAMGFISIGTGQALPVAARMRLFRQSRSVTAGLMLLLFPLMATLSLEPIAVVIALALFGILPAAIAQDVRRPAQLDRAVMLSLLVAAVVLFAGTLRGLNGIAAMSLLAVMGVEALLLTRSKMHRKIIGIFAAGFLAMMIAHLKVESVFGAGTWNITVMLLALVASIWMMVQSLAAALAGRRDQKKAIIGSGFDSSAVLTQSVMTLEKSGLVLGVSHNTERVLGLPREAFLGRGLVDLILVSERPALLKALSDTANGHKTGTVRLNMRCSVEDVAPSYRWVELVVSSSENSAQLFGALRDINDEIFEEAKQWKLEDAADQAKLARGAFLSTINHELRTPLNAIIGFSEILSNPNTIPVEPAKTQEYAKLIHDAGRDLFRKISAMVDVTRLDSGVYEIEKEPTDIRSLLKSAIETFQTEPDAPGVAIEFSDISNDQTLDIDVDSRAIGSIMHQLLSNAAKFGGAAKSIVVSLSSNPRDVIISIKDSGPGIPSDKLELLGQHFARLDETLNRAHGGIGLGLSLTRGIMALHEGEMKIESKPGKGTTVVLTLPRQKGVATGPDNLVQLRSAKPSHVSFEEPKKRRHG